MHDITPFLAPRSIAVVGASTHPAKSGGIILKNIVDGGFPGKIYPINPRAEAILGHRCYPAVAQLPEPCDLAIVVLQRDAVADAVRACVERGVGGVLVITSGFGEAGEQGRAIEASLRAMLEGSATRGLGPNTIGLVSRRARLTATFVAMPTWQDGPVAICAQTGIFAGAVMQEHMNQPYQRLGVGTVLDVGNKLDVDEKDFLAWAQADADTGVVGLYVEGIPDPRAFLKAAEQVARTKPVILLKPGRTASSAAASALHTGSLAVDDRVLAGTLRQHGVVRAGDLADFFDHLHAFACLPLPRGRRVGIVTTSGALGVMAADELDPNGLTLAELAPSTLATLGSVVPAWQPMSNPADVWIALDVVGPRPGIEKPLEAMLADPGVDMVLATVLVPPNADFPEVREVFEGLRDRHPDKPLALVLYGGCRDHWLREIEGLGIPAFSSSRTALRSLAALAGYREWREAAAR